MRSAIQLLALVMVPVFHIWICRLLLKSSTASRWRKALSWCSLALGVSSWLIFASLGYLAAFRPGLLGQIEWTLSFAVPLALLAGALGLILHGRARVLMVAQSLLMSVGWLAGLKHWP